MCVRTSTETEPAMPAAEPPLPPTATMMTFSSWIAVTFRPVPLLASMSAFAASVVSSLPMNASTVESLTRTATEAPTPALPVPIATLPV